MIPTEKPSSRPAARLVLARGLARRCPRCGKARIFTGWYTPRDSCPACAYEFQKHAGDMYGFLYLGAAFFTGLGVLFLYAVARPQTLSGRGLFFLTLAIPLIATMPRRKGLAIALDYLSRSSWGDLADEEREAPPAESINDAEAKEPNP